MPRDNFNPRGRGTYAAQACNICRLKKMKCDGIKPVCGTCGTSGRDAECSWVRNTPVRRPRTEAHFESLRKRADALQAYVDLLERMLAKCVCQDVSSHALQRPEQAGECSGRDGSESAADTSDSDDDITQELCVPAQALKLDDKSGGLLHHGATAPMRFLTRSTKEVMQVTDAASKDASQSYVLFVDGVDAKGYDPDFDWARHLAPEVPLKRKEHDKILDLSFKFFTMFCLRLVPSLFLRDMHRALSVPRTDPPPKTSYYSPMLHNAILSSAALFSDDPRIRDTNSRRYFVTAAKKCLEAECQKPELSLVHALGMIATFHGSNGDHILADLYFGMSARVGQALGLEVDSSAWVKSGLITDEERRARNWAHWTTFSLDLCWTLYVGRDFCAPPPNRPAIPLPIIDAESDQVPWYHPPADIPPQPNLLSLTFSATMSLLLIGRKIVDVVNGLGKDTRGDSVQYDNLVTEIDLELNTWKSRLPPVLDITASTRTKSTPQRLMMHCMYWCCSIVLHRPFFNRRARPVQHSERAVDHVKLCKRAADNITELLETWSSLYTLRYTPPTMLQVVFSAGTVYLLLAVHATSGVRIAQGSLKTSLAQAELCVQRLSEIGKTWSAATRTGDILRGLIEDRLKPVLARRFSHERVCSALGSDSHPGSHENHPPPTQRRTSDRDMVGSTPQSEMPALPDAPPNAVLEWTPILDPYIQTQPHHVEAGRYQMDFDFFGQAGLGVGDLSPSVKSGPFALDGRDLDMSDFLQQTLDSLASSDVWQGGVWAAT